MHVCYSKYRRLSVTAAIPRTRNELVLRNDMSVSRRGKQTPRRLFLASIGYTKRCSHRLSGRFFQFLLHPFAINHVFHSHFSSVIKNMLFPLLIRAMTHGSSLRASIAKRRKSMFLRYFRHQHDNNTNYSE